jgi:hypothetical protein
LVTRTVPAVVSRCLRPYARRGLALPGCLRLVTWTILPIIIWWFDPYHDVRRRALLHLLLRGRRQRHAAVLVRDERESAAPRIAHQTTNTLLRIAGGVFVIVIAGGGGGGGGGGCADVVGVGGGEPRRRMGSSSDCLPIEAATATAVAATPTRATERYRTASTSKRRRGCFFRNTTAMVGGTLESEADAVAHPSRGGQRRARHHPSRARGC